MSDSLRLGMRGITVLVAVLAAAVLLQTTADADAGARPRAAKAKRLKAFPSCPALARYARRYGPRVVGPEPRRGGPPGPVFAPETGDDRAAAPEAGKDFSQTNVQEAGVDEPDIVKTDGSRLFAVSAGKLHALAVDGSGPPRLLGSLALPEGPAQEFLLQGDRLLVVSGGGGIYEPVMDAPIAAQRTVLSEVDVSNPAAMRVTRTLTVDGGYVSARLTGPTARVVISSAPDFVIQRDAEARTQIRRSGASTWLPSAKLKVGRHETRRRLVGCRSVRRPAVFSGLGMLTVLTIDMEKGLPAVDADGLMTDANTVYASDKSLYVATQRWNGTSTTAIHAFDASQRGQTTYRASGEVPGSLLNQWSMSEFEGNLRVASTKEGERESESLVTVLGERLAPVGQVGGLGRGERIYAVRFIGARGFVVTFRQVDPLYTLDLSQPAHPQVLGELKIAGYSAYLHPIGENLLLGVGQDATPEGRTRGVQLSLFDVSNLRAPAKLQSTTIGSGSSSEVEFDHHAFLYWPATGLAVLPVNTTPADPRSGAALFSGAIGFHVDGAAPIAEVGRVSHGSDAQVRRSLVVGDRLFTVSDLGVKASRLDNLTDLTWVPFPA
jgi:uncharacterized secreted protein with C-terminal beta-propeller domain